MKIREVTLEEVEIYISPQEEDLPVHGNAICTDDPEEDKKIEDKILAELKYNIWAWCCVRLTVIYKEWKGITYLGGCSYKDETDFINSDYYQDMVYEALDNLNTDLQKYADIISELEVQ